MAGKWRTGTRFGLGVGLVLAVMGGGTGASYWASAGRPASPVSRRDVPSAEYSEPARANTLAVRGYANTLSVRRYATTLLLGLDAVEKVPAARQQWDEQRAREVARLDDLEKSATHEDAKALVAIMRKELADFDLGLTGVLNLIQDGTIKTPRDARKALNAWVQSSHF